MPIISVITRDGAPHELDAPAGNVLMTLLRDRGLGVAGTCGGMTSCGSCHVYVEGGATLPPASEDEIAMIEALADVVEVRPESRLSCQIRIDDVDHRLVVRVAPQF